MIIFDNAPLNSNNVVHVPCLIKTKLMDNNIIYQHIKSLIVLKTQVQVLAMHHSTPLSSASMHTCTYVDVRGCSVDQNGRNERNYGAT